jgi:hypothetical protein
LGDFYAAFLSHWLLRLCLASNTALLQSIPKKSHTMLLFLYRPLFCRADNDSLPYQNSIQAKGFYPLA